VSPVRRRSSAVFLAAGALFGVGACGCGSSSSAPPSTTSTTATPASSAHLSQWLVSQAGQWNAALNGDQGSVDTAASATSGVSSSAYFSRLSGACTKMLDDAEKGRTVPPAPSTTLEDAWNGMLTATETYANRCLRVVHTQSSSDLTAWKDSLTSMNSANRTWNQEVAKVQNASSSTSTSSTSSTSPSV
jgi:hypothetical protein